MPTLDLHNLGAGQFGFPAPVGLGDDGGGDGTREEQNCAARGGFWDGERCSDSSPGGGPGPGVPPGGPGTRLPPGDCPGGQTRGPNGECGSPDCPDGTGILVPGGPCVGGAQATGHRDTTLSSGGGGGRGGVVPRPITYSDRATDFNALLERMIREGLAAPSRFTPEALQALYGQITRQASNRITRGERAVRAEAARRGMQRAGSTSAALRGVREGAESERGAAVVNVQLAKINADYADKNAALDRAQRYLDSLRDSEYRMLVASEQRRQFDANLALAYANLAQQRTLLEMQLQSEWDRLRALMGFTLLGQGV